MIGPVHEEPGRQLGRVRPHRVDGREVEGREHDVELARAHEVDRGAGHRVLRVGVRLPPRALHLDVHQPPRARVERFGQRRQPRAGGADLGERLLDQQAERFDRGVVMDDEDAVGGAAHVQLDPVGTQIPRPHEGVDGVLPGQAVGAPMGQYERSRRHAVQVTSIQKTQRVPLLTVNVLVRTLARWCARPLPCRFSLRGSGQRRPDTHVSGRTRPASVRPIRRGN